MSVNADHHLGDEDFDLRQNYQSAIECLVQCQSVMDDMQKQLASKDEKIASLEQEIVQMSFDLASLRAFEDAQRSKRRVVHDVDFTDGSSDGEPRRRPPPDDATRRRPAARGRGGAPMDVSDYGDDDESLRRPPSDDRARRGPVARGRGGAPADVSVVEAGARPLERRFSDMSMSWGGPDCPAGLDDSASSIVRIRRGGRRRESSNGDWTTQETEEGRHVTEEKRDTRRNDHNDYGTLWRDCVNLREEIQRSSFYLDMTRLETNAKRVEE